MKKTFKPAVLLTSATFVSTLVPVLTSCNKNLSGSIQVTCNLEYFVDDQIKKEDIKVVWTNKVGTQKEVTDWECEPALPYTFTKAGPHEFTVKYHNLQSKFTKIAFEHQEKININFIPGEHGRIEEHHIISIQAPVKWSAVIKPIVYPESGYEFDKWVDEEGVEISKDKVLKRDCTVKALFKEQPAAEKGLKFIFQRLAGQKFFSVEWDGSDSINKDLVIPSKHYYVPDGVEYPVLWVRSFTNCPYIEKLTIPSCVVSIGSDCFAYNLSTGHSKLKTITFEPNSQCEEIYERAFQGCEYLTGITIPKSITKIHQNAFDMDGKGSPAFKTLTFEQDSKIQTISQDAFKGCVELTTVTLPNGLKTVGGFNDTSLTSINLPDSVTEILNDSFSTSSFNQITIGTGSKLSKIGERAFKSSKITTIDIPDSVTSIGSSGFNNCEELTNVNFTDNSKLKILGTTGGRVFEGCIKLTSFTIPASVTNIGSNLFGSAVSTELTSLTFKDLEHKWKAGYVEPLEFTPTNNPETNAPAFIAANDGRAMTKVIS